MKYLTDPEKNVQVNTCLDLMLSKEPGDKEKFKEILLDIIKDCRLFGSHLELEMERHVEEPDVFPIEDVYASCRAFRRESISNVYGWANRKILEWKDKKDKGVMEQAAVSLAEAVFQEPKVVEPTVVEV